MRAYLTILIVCLTALGGCAYPTVTRVEPERMLASASSIDSYTLGVDDKIRAIVYEETGLSGEFQVGGDGNLALPLVGQIPAVGKTTSQIAQEYQTRLSDGYLRNPRVSIEVVTYRPFFILGEVSTPNRYPYANALTAMNAIATAGGFTPRAERARVFIRRAGTAEERAYELTPDLLVLPGDTIRVGERAF